MRSACGLARQNSIAGSGLFGLGAWGLWGQLWFKKSSFAVTGFGVQRFACLGFRVSRFRVTEIGVYRASGEQGPGLGLFHDSLNPKLS